MTTTTKVTTTTPKTGKKKQGERLHRARSSPSMRARSVSVPIVGVDPGARATGIVLVGPGGLVAARTVENVDGDLLPPPAEYVGRVVATVEELRVMIPGVVVAVESVTRPSWHVAKAASRGAAGNPTALLGTAVVLGAVLGAYPGAVLVRPGGNGSAPLGVYPADLVSVGERRKPGWELRVGGGKLRHQRSAWDVALAAVM